MTQNKSYLARLQIFFLATSALFMSCSGPLGNTSVTTTTAVSTTSIANASPTTTAPPYSLDCGVVHESNCYVEISSPLIYFELKNLALLCVYYQEFDGHPNQKQMNVLRAGQESIDKTASELSGNDQALLGYWADYMWGQIDFWETYPDANYKPASLSFMKNPCELESVLFRMKENGLDISALEALSV